MDFPHGEPVDILSPTLTTDPYSGESAGEDWENFIIEATVVCGIEPRPNPEATQEARNAVTDGFTIYAPAGTSVTARNRVRVRDEIYAVDGTPASWRSPFTGWAPGVVIQCKRTEG